MLVRGWRPGFRKVGAARVLCERGGYSLGEANRLVQRILDEQQVEVPVPGPEAEHIASELTALGANAECSREE